MKPFLFFLLLPLLLSCQSVQVDESLKDWANVTLRVAGSGAIPEDWTISDRMLAIQKAKIDAYAQLAAKIMQLKTDSRKTISELASEDKEMQKKILAFVKGAKIINTENKDSGVNITAELFLGEHFKASIGLSKRRTSAPSSLQRERDRGL